MIVVKNWFAQLFVKIQRAVVAEERVDYRHPRGKNPHDKEQVGPDQTGHDSNTIGQGHDVKEVLRTTVDEEECHGDSRRDWNQCAREILCGPSTIRASKEFALSCGHVPNTRHPAVESPASSYEKSVNVLTEGLCAAGLHQTLRDGNQRTAGDKSSRHCHDSICRTDDDTGGR